MADNARREVMKLNKTFYKAVETSNIDLMDKIWICEPRARCVHPGWPMLHGWKAIRKSWEKIFESGAPTSISLLDVRVDVSEGLAWVICIEKISYGEGPGESAGFAQTTNIYEHTEHGWNLVLHHASPIPMPRVEVENDRTLQ